MCAGRGSREGGIAYAYPMWHTVSFTLVARQHVAWMKRLGARVLEIDELIVPRFEPTEKYSLVLHPFFYMFYRVLASRKPLLGEWREEYYQWWKSRFEQVVGVDVCDSDAYSQLAVEMANRVDKLVVPSRFCVEVAEKNGIRSRVYRVQHGVEPEWLELPNVWEAAPPARINPSLLEAFVYKAKRGVRYLLFWLWHSPERKGFPELLEFYRELKRERRDAVLLLWTLTPNSPAFQALMPYGVVNVYGWTTRVETMSIFDLADVTLNFSRGGGFELTCLESLARGVPCVASRWGSWLDYMPPFLTVKPGRRVQPLPGNAIHTGYGYAVDVDDAVGKVLDILDNYDDYKARTEEWRRSVLAKEYRWDLAAEKLLEVIRD